MGKRQAMESIPRSEEDQGVDYQYGRLRLYYCHKARHDKSALLQLGRL